MEDIPKKIKIVNLHNHRKWKEAFKKIMINCLKESQKNLKKENLGLLKADKKLKEPIHLTMVKVQINYQK